MAVGPADSEAPALRDEGWPLGEFSRYKGRWYGRLPLLEGSLLVLPARTLDLLQLAPGMHLLSIRSSDIAFTMGAKGPLLERAARYEGEIPMY